MRRVRLGMVGGGEGAFIGAVHRIAARLDARFVLLAGALSADPDRARRSGVTIGLDADRSYAGYRAMFDAEKSRADGIEAISIETPNHLHAPIAIAAFGVGLHVICNKPLATSRADALAMRAAAEAACRVLAVTYNYSGYPMVREARTLIASGALGAVRTVQVEVRAGMAVDSLEG